jgi:heat-inducible transcriptional repressor
MLLGAELSERERDVLRFIVQQFIMTASPVGSRNITRKYNLSFSPATVRNIMSDLEEFGYVNHPHTSAGRVPTDMGYRFYVNSLMRLEDLTSSDKNSISEQIESAQHDSDDLYAITSKLLSAITHQLACVVYPNFDSAILERIQIIVLSSTRLLVVLSIHSGLIKTITLELSSSLDESKVRRVQTILNERLSGLSMTEARATFHDRMKDYDPALHPVMTLFLNSAEKIFKHPQYAEKAVISGTGNLLKQPEFDGSDKLQTVVELIEDREVIVHVFERAAEHNQRAVGIRIGKENEMPQLEDFSLITKEYTIGGVTGHLGVVGPKRMEYSRIVAIVDYVGTILGELLTNK